MAEIKETTTVVKELIETYNEREAGYKKAADLVENAKAKELFLKYAAQSAEFAKELEVYHFEQDGSESLKNESNTLFCGWTELKSTITGKDTKALYAWCELGEDAALNKFKGICASIVPSEIRPILDKQLLAIKEAHGYVKALRDA